MERDEPYGRLAASLADNMRKLEEQRKAQLARMASLSGNARFIAEARAQAEADTIVRDKATLQAIETLRDVAKASAEESARYQKEAVDRETASANREARMVGLTRAMQKLTALLLVVGVITLAVAIASAVHEAKVITVTTTRVVTVPAGNGLKPSHPSRARRK